MFRRRIVAPFALASLLALAGAAAPARAGSLEDGKRLLDERRYEAAADAYRKVLKASAGNRDALFGLAKAVSDGKLGPDAYQEVEGLLRERLKASADDRQARLALGDLFLAWVFTDDRYRADAQDQFQKLATADPKDADAAVGLARVYWIAGDTPHGMELLDEFLGRIPTSAVALHGKGAILYADASNLFRAEQLSERVKGLFARAAGSFEAATKADPKRKDSWMQLAYANQYLAGVEPPRAAVAADAYEKALALDGDDLAPLRGLAALLAPKPDAWAATLERVGKAFPKAPAVLFFQAEAAKAAGKLDAAEAGYRAYIAGTKAPALGWASLGDLLEAKQDADGATKAYHKSLELDADSWRASTIVSKLLGAINARAEESWADGAKAHKLLDDYRALAALAPSNKAVRNDGGFFCREAYAKSGKRDAALLKASVELYASACELIPEYREWYEQTIPYKDRHVYAQILNDTGLMFQYEPANLNLAKAEDFYKKAMEWTQFGYWDAYGNMMKIYVAQGRWQEAYDFAASCAEGIKKEDGTPNQTFRATCAAARDQLEAKLPKDK